MIDYETRARAQLRMLLDVHGGADALRAALSDGMVDGSLFWDHYQQRGCLLGIVLAADGAEDPAHSAATLRGFESLEAWAQAIEPGDSPDLLAWGKGPLRAAMLVQWVDEWEAERVAA